jgi:RNA polymerase-binding transcription factor DksA
MDEIDFAQARQEENNADALAAVRANVPEEKYELTEDVECSCGTTIDPRRARLGYVCCIDCQSYMEKSNKQYNRRGSRNYDDLD